MLHLLGLSLCAYLFGTEGYLLKKRGIHMNSTSVICEAICHSGLYVMIGSLRHAWNAILVELAPAYCICIYFVHNTTYYIYASS